MVALIDAGATANRCAGKLVTRSLNQCSTDVYMYNVHLHGLRQVNKQRHLTMAMENTDYLHNKRYRLVIAQNL